jgi:hypothetical protein
VREIRMLRATWRGLETWHGRDASANWRASPRPYRESRSSVVCVKFSKLGMVSERG